MKCAAILITVLLAGCTQMRDDSDPPNGASGMGVHTDALTGCQYLSRYRGGITPRMGADGKQICGSKP